MKLTLVILLSSIGICELVHVEAVVGLGLQFGTNEVLPDLGLNIPSAILNDAFELLVLRRIRNLKGRDAAVK